MSPNDRIVHATVFAPDDYEFRRGVRINAATTPSDIASAFGFRGFRSALVVDHGAHGIGPDEAILSCVPFGEDEIFVVLYYTFPVRVLRRAQSKLAEKIGKELVTSR